MQWWRYKKKQKSENKLIKNIKKKFGKDAILAYGSWNRISQMKGLIPSPTTGIYKVLSKHFDVVTVPEYNTTKTCNKCMKKTLEPVKRRACPCCESIRKGAIRDAKTDELKETIREKGILCKRCQRHTSQREYDVRGLRRCKNAECAVYVNRVMYSNTDHYRITMRL